MSDESLTLIFRSGVARIDASGNIFVHVTHTPEDPAPTQVGSESVKTPGDVRRIQVVGTGSGAVQGEFPPVNDLPRGLLVDLRGFDSAEFVDGALAVTFSGVVDVPSWCKAGVENVFDRPAESLRLWSKSALPDGVTLGTGAAAGKAAVRTQGKRAPTLAKVVDADAPSPKPDPTPAPKATAEPSAPYRPDRLPAGAYAEKKDNASSSLGCGTLVALAAVAMTTLALLA